MSRASVERQRAHFNSIAERYRDARQHPNHLRLKELMWADFLADKPELRKDNLRVLEAMCGWADGKKILEHHLGATLDYSGFDYADEVVEDVRKAHPDWDVYQADVTTFEPRRTVDVVILLGGLHHVPHAAQEALERVASALEPGGLFINLEPTHGNPVFKAVREGIYQRNTLFDEQTERAFTTDEYDAMFARAGFTARDVVYPGLLAYVLYYNPDAFPWLNVGSTGQVDALVALERPLWRSQLARSLSFATLACWAKT